MMYHTLQHPTKLRRDIFYEQIPYQFYPIIAVLLVAYITTDQPKYVFWVIYVSNVSHFSLCDFLINVVRDMIIVCTVKITFSLGNLSTLCLDQRFKPYTPVKNDLYVTFELYRHFFMFACPLYQSKLRLLSIVLMCFLR